MEALSFQDTGQEDEANEAPFSVAYLPTGWSVIWSNDFEYASPSNILRLSSPLRLIGCQVEEHVMFTACHAAKDGRALWNVWHNFQEGGIYDLNSSGEVPKEFEIFAATRRAEQDAAGGDKSEVDYCSEVPLDLAMALTGYRHDRFRFDWGEPRFTVIEPLRRRRFWPFRK